MPLTKLEIDHDAIFGIIKNMITPGFLGTVWHNDEQYHELRLNDWLDIECINAVVKQLPKDLNISNSRIVAEMLERNFTLPAHKDGTRKASVYIPLTCLDCPLELYNSDKQKVLEYYHDNATLINAQSYHGTTTKQKEKIGLQFSLYEEYSVLEERLKHLS